MRCQDVHSLVTSYYQGKLDEYTKIRIHHHLAQCKECQEDYEMWVLGEELIQHSQPIQVTPAQKERPSLVMSQVMGRIQQEEKWANPNVKTTSSYTPKSKKMYSFIGSMLLIFFILFFATLFIPDQEMSTHQSIPVEKLENWDINKIVMKESVAQHEETTMKFSVVASISDPIIYMLPVEKEPLPYGIIFSVFGFLCIILGMSWLTRL